MEKSQDKPTGYPSYRTKEPPTFSEEEKKRFAKGSRLIRTDVENLQYNSERRMYFFPKVDKVKDSYSTDHNISCIIF